MAYQEIIAVKCDGCGEESSTQVVVDQLKQTDPGEDCREFMDWRLSREGWVCARGAHKCPHCVRVEQFDRETALAVLGRWATVGGDGGREGR